MNFPNILKSLLDNTNDFCTTYAATILSITRDLFGIESVTLCMIPLIVISLVVITITSYVKTVIQEHTIFLILPRLRKKVKRLNDVSLRSSYLFIFFILLSSFLADIWLKFFD